MQDNRMIKIFVLITTTLSIIALIAFIFIKPIYIRNQLPKPVLINTTDQPTLGNTTAKIHFVVFEDLKCVNCARFNNKIFPLIKKNYINTGKATYTMINLAFIPGSMPAANAARCVYKQNHALFFKYLETIYKNQPPEESNWATVPRLMIFASKIKGINTDQLAQCLIQTPYNQLIQNNLKEASDVMNHLVATPALYINGIKVEPLTMARIQEIVRVI